MKNDNAQLWEKALTHIDSVKNEIGKIIIGQEKIIEQMLIALLCRGHCLIVGVPGLAKTLLVSTLGDILGLSFRRIQFTPDLMPSDIIGSEILQEGDRDRPGSRKFEFMHGPIFANLILADEINRTPPKTQSALLEAMQEKQVTIAGRTMDLIEPFIVFATQNPIEHEGTYPLPEAQLDRFFFNLVIEYPNAEEEREVVLKTTGRREVNVSSVLSAEELISIQDMVLDIPVPDHVLDYIMKLVQASRPTLDTASDFIKKYIAWGAGPRAAQFLTMGAKAQTMLRGNTAASIEDVIDIAPAVLRHRIIPNYNATGEGVMVEEIIHHIIDEANEI